MKLIRSKAVVPGKLGQVLGSREGLCKTRECGEAQNQAAANRTGLHYENEILTNTSR